MSRLHDLIQQLCPDGVPFRALGTIVKIKNGRDYKKLAPGTIPVYGSGGVMAYVDEASFGGPSVLIPRKGSIDKLYYVDEPFWNIDTIFYTDIDSAAVIPKYLYYYLAGQHLEKLNESAARPALTQTILNGVPVPVPPLDVQREIVRILDHFTQLEAELEEQLQAELEARKQQYAHYRDRLLSFGNSERERERK
jgi:type I restriction enzyme S subunit